MSKFVSEAFYGDDGVFFGVSKERFTFEEAQKVAERELDGDVTPLSGDWFARWRIGYDEDGDRCIGWWLDYGAATRSCPVWAFERK